MHMTDARPNKNNTLTQVTLRQLHTDEYVKLNLNL